MPDTSMQLLQKLFCLQNMQVTTHLVLSKSRWTTAKSQLMRLNWTIRLLNSLPIPLMIAILTSGSMPAWKAMSFRDKRRGFVEAQAIQFANWDFILYSWQIIVRVYFSLWFSSLFCGLHSRLALSTWMDDIQSYWWFLWVSELLSLWWICF